MSSNGFRVEVTGLMELARDAKLAGDVAVPRAMRLSNLEIAKEVANKGRAGAPVGKAADGDAHPGMLAGSVRGTASPMSASVVAGGPKQPYTQAVHWGWPKHNITANPFLKRGAAGVEADPVRWYSRVFGAATMETA